MEFSPPRVRWHAMTLALALIAGISAAPALEVYWDFNTESKAPSLGSGTLTTSATGVNIIDIEEYDTGTTVNAAGSTPAGKALSYPEIAQAFSDHIIIMDDINTSGLTNISLSFAFRSTEVFSLGDEEIIVDYDPNGGSSFEGAQVLELSGSSWSTWTSIPFSFGSALDNKADVSIRIRTTAAFELNSDLQYDNIQILPEPSSSLLLMSGALILTGTLRRRQDRSLPNAG